MHKGWVQIVAKLQKKNFQVQVDPNTGVAMYESDDIIKYLVGKYGIPHYTNLVSVDLFLVSLSSINCSVNRLFSHQLIINKLHTYDRGR